MIPCKSILETNFRVRMDDGSTRVRNVLSTAFKLYSHYILFNAQHNLVTTVLYIDAISDQSS